MRRLLIPLVAILTLMLLGSGLAAAFSGDDLSAPTAEDKASAQADYQPATGLDTRRPVPSPQDVGGSGIIEPRERPSSLSVAVGGLIAELAVEEGQEVEAGAVLVRLDAGLASADLAAATADERSARADLEAARAEADAAETRAASSALTLSRLETLYQRGSANADDRDRAAKTAEADAQTATAARARSRRSQSAVAAAAARRQQSEARLEQLVVRAPSRGEVLQLLLKPGEFVAPGAALVVLGDTSQLRARLDIDERDVVGVRVGQSATIRIEGIEDPVSGSVVSVGRRTGRKIVRTDDPTDRVDARFVEVVVALDRAPAGVPMGVRVDGTLRRSAGE